MKLATAGGVAGALTLMGLGEVLPEPTDPLFIWISDWLRVNQAQIPPWQYWSVFIFNVWFLSALWYFFIAILVLSLDVAVEQRAFLGIGLVSGGAVVGLLGYLMAGRELPGVSSLGLGYVIVFAGIAAFTAVTATLILFLREKTEVL